MTDAIARRAGALLRRYRRYLIAATAEDPDATLVMVTLNTRHFPMFRGLKPEFTG
ncbi:MAG: hypothetical protein ACRD1K_14050 [Acidimicrobiales bacterium]